MNSLNRHAFSMLTTVGLFLFGCGLVLFGQAPANAVEAILLSHGAGLVPPPISVEMTGTVEHDGRTEPFRILATRDEELRIEYGNQGKDTNIVTPKFNFHDDGRKIASRPVPAGFAQLDVTGLFFVGQLRNRAVQIVPTQEWTSIGTTPARRVQVRSERTQTHKSRIRVEDSLDLYITEGGLLAGVARRFYEGRPDQYTQSFAFSDFRKTDGLLLPYRIEVYVQARLKHRFQVERYAFDVRTDRDLFLPRRSQ